MNIRTLLVTGFIFTVLVISTQSWADAFDARFRKVELETHMLIGQNYTAKVTVRNTGTSTWQASDRIEMAVSGATNDSWGLSPVSLQGREVKPGDDTVFSFPVKAVSRTGIFSLQFEMHKAGNVFGSRSETLNIVVETKTNRVKFISQLLPNTMNAGQDYNIVVQFKNNGSVTWTRDSGYQLGLQAPKGIWNITRVQLSSTDEIKPGDTATFRFELKAPETPGTYPVEWQMKVGNRFFGESAPTQKIEVTESQSNSGAEFVYQKVPGLQKSNQQYAIFELGEVYPVTLTFKNTSETTWTAGHYALVAQNPASNMNWSIDRVDLKNSDVIKPGEIKTFNFKVIAPLKPGIYDFQWQMVQGFNTFFGEKSDVISITVK